MIGDLMADPALVIRIDHYVHQDAAQDEVLQQLNAKMDILIRQERKEMATVQDVQQKVQALQTDIEEQTTVTQGVVTAVEGMTQLIADLRAQLQQAIQANDPVALQAVVDGMTTAEASLKANTDKLATATTTNTETPVNG